MNNAFVSQDNALRASVAALLVFLGRAFIDYYYVYGDLGLNTGMVTLSIAINLALFGGWIWGLMATAQGSRRGAMVVLGLDLFFLVTIAVGTLVAYCPSPCATAWPLGEITNWLSLLVSALAALTGWAFLRQGWS